MELYNYCMVHPNLRNILAIPKVSLLLHLE